jgi:Protein of unknown function (DUF3141)
VDYRSLSSVDDIRMHGQTIVYAIHDSIGHLGIFVSAAVARKEHDEFASNIDLIDVLPPGLYEAVLHHKAPDDPNAEMAHGDYIARFEERTLDHIRALGGNDEEDERRFATVARLSEINSSLYRTFVSPWVRAWTSELSAEYLRRLHPLSLQYELVSDMNPLLRSLPGLAAKVRSERKPVFPDNMFLAWQENVSNWIVESLKKWGDQRDSASEQTFLGLYSSPFVQAAVGERTSDEPPRHRQVKEPLQLALIDRQIAELRRRMTQGGIREAAIRAMIYVAMATGSADERAFAVLRQIRAEHGVGITLAAFKAIVREQFFMLLVDEDEALRTLPQLAGQDRARLGEVVQALRRVATATGPLAGDEAVRLARIERLLESQSGTILSESEPQPDSTSPRRSERGKTAEDVPESAKGVQKAKAG